MENIKDYGDLSDKELSEFLAEIANDDDDLQEAQDLAQEKVDLEEITALPDEEIENRKLESQYGDFTDKTPPVKLTNNADKKINSKKVISQKLWGLKNERLKIQQEAFNQDLLPLSTPIEPDKIKLLISLLVREHTRMVDKYRAYINKRLATLLRPLIPRRLRACKDLFPHSIRVSPGFLYKASEEYGDGLTFWACPDIPYYFKQNSEQSILLEYKPWFLVKVDLAVKYYHAHLSKRTDKELQYASLILTKNVKTYYDLLKLNPFWYKLLFDNITKQ